MRKLILPALSIMMIGRALGQAPPACDACAAWNVTQAPIRLYGNSYYVGVRGLSSVLIASNEGHVLIDADLPGSCSA